MTYVAKCPNGAHLSKNMCLGKPQKESTHKKQGRLFAKRDWFAFVIMNMGGFINEAIFE